MDRKTAKEFLHLRDWLGKAQELIGAGRDAYTNDQFRQEVLAVALFDDGGVMFGADIDDAETPRRWFPAGRLWSP